MEARDHTRLQRMTFRVWLWVGIVLLTAAALWVLARPLSVVIPPVLVAVVLVYLLNPIVSGLSRLRVPRLLGTLLAFIILIGALVGMGALLAPMLVEQITSFAEVAPELGQEFNDRFSGWLAGMGVDLEAVIGQFDTEQAAEQVQDVLGDADARSAVMTLIGGLGGLFAGMLNLFLALFVGPFIAAYLLWDLPRAQAWAYAAVPARHREELAEVGRRLSQVVGGFIRGQLLVAAYVGIATSIGFAIIGLPFWLVLGVIAGVTNLVPLIGPFVAGLLGALVALFTDGLGLAIAVVVVVTIVQQGDNQIVSPLVMGRTVRLHPLVVLLALLVAGVLYGVFGLLVAVPVVAAARVLLSHLWHTRVPWAEDDPKDAVPAGHGVGNGTSSEDSSGEEAAERGGSPAPEGTGGGEPGDDPETARTAPGG